VPFEPIPLYAVLRSRGFDHVMEQSMPSTIVVRFFRPGAQGPDA
jgi:hypothetical protein